MRAAGREPRPSRPLIGIPMLRILGRLTHDRPLRLAACRCGIPPCGSDMDLAPRLKLMNWLVSQGLAGLAENDLVRGFCERCRAEGLDLSRGLVFIDTLHPIFEGRGFRWNDTETNESDSFEYGPTGEGDAAQRLADAPPSFTCWSTAMTKCGSTSPIAPRSTSRQSTSLPQKATVISCRSCIGSVKPEPSARWTASIPTG